MEKVRVWQTATIGEDVAPGYATDWFIGSNGDWGGDLDVDLVAAYPVTTVEPPQESIKDGHPCKWNGSAWYLLADGDAAFARWDSDVAKETLRHKDAIGDMQRKVEELIEFAVNGTPISSYAVADRQERVDLRARIIS